MKHMNHKDGKNRYATTARRNILAGFIALMMCAPWAVADDLPEEPEIIVEEVEEASVNIVLRWLKKHQNADGSWPQCKPAMTGLAVLCFLSHCETGDSPEFGETFRKAVEYLVYTYKDRRWEGSDGNEYAFPIATYALSEAYGMTGNPNIRPVIEDAVKRIIEGQNPSGGWDYNLKQTDRNDTSYMAWCALALRSARNARIFRDNPEWLEKLEIAGKKSNYGFLQNAKPGGGFGYTGPDDKGLSALGVLCMQLNGMYKHPQARDTLALMDSWQPGWFATREELAASGMDCLGGSTQYYYFFATQAKFYDGDKRFKKWYEGIDSAYALAQKVQKKAYPDHNGVMRDIGWWENSDEQTDDPSRALPVMDTCLASFQLSFFWNRA